MLETVSLLSVCLSLFQLTGILCLAASLSHRNQFYFIFIFLLHLNDLPLVIESCQRIMYYDATKIDSDLTEELESNLNSDLGKIKDYFNVSRLSLDAHKCDYIVMGIYQSLAKMPKMPIHINNDHEPLHKVTRSKYIGMFIGTNLKWNDHILISTT